MRGRCARRTGSGRGNGAQTRADGGGQEQKARPPPREDGEEECDVGPKAEIKLMSLSFPGAGGTGGARTCRKLARDHLARGIRRREKHLLYAAAARRSDSLIWPRARYDSSAALTTSRTASAGGNDDLC